MSHGGERGSSIDSFFGRNSNDKGACPSALISWPWIHYRGNDFAGRWDTNDQPTGTISFCFRRPGFRTDKLKERTWVAIVRVQYVYSEPSGMGGDYLAFYVVL